MQASEVVVFLSLCLTGYATQVMPCVGAYPFGGSGEENVTYTSKCMPASHSHWQFCGPAYAASNPQTSVCDITEPANFTTLLEEDYVKKLISIAENTTLKKPLSEKCEATLVLATCATFAPTCDSAGKVSFQDGSLAMSPICKCLCDILRAECGPEVECSEPGASNTNTNCSGAAFCGKDNDPTLVV
jgi:hypothetical protein